jgi:hypothetical protein
VARFVLRLVQASLASDWPDRYHPPIHMLRARPVGIQARRGASKSFGRPYRDRAGSRFFALTGLFAYGT